MGGWRGSVVTLGVGAWYAQNGFWYRNLCPIEVTFQVLRLTLAYSFAQLYSTTLHEHDCHGRKQNLLCFYSSVPKAQGRRQPGT